MDAELDQSTERQWSEGRSPLCAVREIPMSKHAEGPWFIRPEPDEAGLAVIEDGRQAGLHPIRCEWTEAPLVATAPDLLDALEATTRELIGERDCLYESVSLPDGSIPDGEDQAGIAELDRVIDQARAAIAKAKGEQA